MNERAAGFIRDRVGDVLVVIPAFNEERSVGPVVTSVRARAGWLCGGSPAWHRAVPE
jgi:hypothetical protein